MFCFTRFSLEGQIMQRLSLAALCIGLTVNGAWAQAPMDPGAPPLLTPLEPAPKQPAPLDEAELRQRMAGGRGSVAVRAVQGTPGGAAVGVAPVEIILIHRGQVVHTEKAELDEHGVVVVEGLPVAMEVTPVVQVNYAGVFYQETGTTINPQNNHATIEVTVYETTDEAPDWRIAMRHVMLEQTEAGLLVSEMIVTSSNAERTWLGDLVDDSPDAKRTAARFTLPHRAKDVQLLAGFHGWCCTTLDDSGTLGVQMPMMPGEARYRFSYVLPVNKGQAEMLLSAPAPTDHIIAFLADDGTRVTPQGMTDAGAETMGTMRVRLFQADALAANQVAGLTLAGLTSAGALQAASDASGRIKTFAGIGAAVVLLAGIAFVFLRPRPARAPA